MTVLAPSPAGYRVVARSDSAEIYLYGPIGASWFGDGVTAKQFADDLKKLGAVKTIDLRVNSEGGDVFDGKAMYTLLVEHKATIIVHVDGLAASAASFVAMAGNEIRIAEGAFMMVHDAWGLAIGNAAEMRRMAELLGTVSETIAQVYAARTGKPRDEIAAMMAEETWLTGTEAVEQGFADKTVENLKVAASVRDPAKYRRLPAALRPRRAAARALLTHTAALVRR